MADLTDIPVSYDELPRNEVLSMNFAWGVFGEQDELGTVSLLTPARVRAAAGEVKLGTLFNLSLPLDLPRPTRNGRRTAYRHTIIALDRNTQDDVIDNFHPQGSSQWDSLRHVGAREFGYYNGFTAAEVGPQGDRLGIDRWAEHGLVGRGLLLDIPRHFEKLGQPYDPLAGTKISPEDLSAVISSQGSEVETGDVLLIRTGYVEAYLSTHEDKRASFPVRWSGLSAGEDMARFLWDLHVSAVVTDNPAVEVAPGDPDDGFLHRRLIPLLGFALGELFTFEALAADSADDGRYTSMFIAVPMNLPRGVGSPGNAIAIK